MAEKTLNTRIKLKYDTYANWSSANPVLKAGEFAAAYTSQKCNIDSDNKTLTNDETSGTIPAGSVLLKVGDGENHYNNLPFVHAIPADSKISDSVDIPYVICDTAADNPDKVLIIDNFVLSDGTKIVVKFTNTNTANNPYFVIPTDTVTTYRNPICYRGSAIPSNALTANGTYTFVYNGTQWEFVGDIATSITILEASDA